MVWAMGSDPGAFLPLGDDGPGDALDPAAVMGRTLLSEDAMKALNDMPEPCSSPDLESDAPSRAGYAGSDERTSTHVVHEPAGPGPATGRLSAPVSSRRGAGRRGTPTGPPAVSSSVGDFAGGGPRAGSGGDDDDDDDDDDRLMKSDTFDMTEYLQEMNTLFVDVEGADVGEGAWSPIGGEGGRGEARAAARVDAAVAWRGGGAEPGVYTSGGAGTIHIHLAPLAGGAGAGSLLGHGPRMPLTPILEMGTLERQAQQSTGTLGRSGPGSTTRDAREGSARASESPEARLDDHGQRGGEGRGRRRAARGVDGARSSSEAYSGPSPRRVGPTARSRSKSHSDTHRQAPRGLREGGGGPEAAGGLASPAGGPAPQRTPRRPVPGGPPELVGHAVLPRIRSQSRSTRREHPAPSPAPGPRSAAPGSAAHLAGAALPSGGAPDPRDEDAVGSRRGWRVLRGSTIQPGGLRATSQSPTGHELSRPRALAGVRSGPGRLAGARRHGSLDGGRPRTPPGEVPNAFASSFSAVENSLLGGGGGAAPGPGGPAPAWHTPSPGPRGAAAPAPAGDAGRGPQGGRLGSEGPGAAVPLPAERGRAEREVASLGAGGAVLGRKMVGSRSPRPHERAGARAGGRGPAASGLAGREPASLAGRGVPWGPLGTGLPAIRRGCRPDQG